MQHIPMTTLVEGQGFNQYFSFLQTVHKRCMVFDKKRMLNVTIRHSITVCDASADEQKWGSHHITVLRVSPHGSAIVSSISLQGPAAYRFGPTPSSTSERS